jgi:hypothetical protein
MKPTFALALFTLALLGGCVTPASVDYDREAVPQIASYGTFAIDGREARSEYQDVALSPIVDRRFERAIREALIDRGFSQSSSQPDFRVTFNTVTKTRTELNDYGPRTFRRYPYYGYGGRYLDLDEYEEGTFIVDIIDAQSQQLVWRGAYVRRLGWSAPDEAEVLKIVTAILTSFPPGAE